MYTPDQYARAKAQVDQAPADKQAILRQRMGEYEATLPNAERPGKLTGFLDAGPEGPNVPALPPESSVYKFPALGEQVNAPGAPDPNIDLSLPNASKLKQFSAPAEYVAKNPLNGVKHIAAATLGDPLDGPQANTYREPSQEQFVNDQGALLKARGIPFDPRDERFADQFAEYKDRKWQQAYQKAAAADLPLTRAEYVQHSGAWDKLKDAVVDAADMGSAFAKGYARAATLHGTDVLAAVSDKLSGRDDVGSDRAQTERDPYAEGAGELAGATRTGGPLASITEGAASIGAKIIPGAAGRIAGAALGGAVAGEAENAARSVAQGLGDMAHGRSGESAKDNFTSHLLGSGLIGGGLGAVGGVAAEGAGAVRKWVRPGTGDLAREIKANDLGGGATDVIRGVVPSKAVAANIETARPPLPGELNKPNLETTPQNVAAQKLHEPLTAQNAKDNADFTARAERENAAAYAADPNLQQPKPARNIVDSIIDTIKKRSREETGAEIPSPDEALVAHDNKPLVSLLRQATKAKVVTAVEAANEAQATGGRVVTLGEAKALGYSVSPHTPDPETGVPPDAPAIPDEPQGPPGGSTADVFGRQADKPTPWNGRDLGPRAGRAKAPPAQEPGSDWDSRGRDDARFEHVRGQRPELPGDVYVPTPNSNPSVPFEGPLPKFADPEARALQRYEPPDSSALAAKRPPLPGESLPPRAPPPEATDYAETKSGTWSPITATPAAKTAQAAGVPDEQLRVLIEPRSFNAQKYETIISGLDDLAKAGRAQGNVDPAFKDFQRAARADREQFSPEWAELKDKHYRTKLALESRAGFANIAPGNKPHSEMSANDKKTFEGGLLGYGSTEPAKKSANDAYRALADAAGPKVRAELETLRAQTAYDSLKTKATPNMRESAGAGGATTRIGGLGTAAKLRADAAARGVSRGPKGLPPIDPKTLSPELLALIRQGNPIGREYKPVGAMANMFSMGKGALGLKAGSVYNSLTPAEQKRLDGLLEATKEAQ